MRFRARVIPSGNATGVEVPADVMKALGPGSRPLIAVTINGHAWRSRVASMRGQHLVGISAANRAASGIAEGDVVEVDLELDTEPRVVTEPPDLAKALNGDPEARAAFDRSALWPQAQACRCHRGSQDRRSSTTQDRQVGRNDEVRVRLELVSQ